MTDTASQPTRYTMIPIEVRVPVDLRHDREVATDIEMAAQEYANETYGRDYDGSEPEPVSNPLHEFHPATWTWDQIRAVLDEERAAWETRVTIATRTQDIAGQVLDRIEGRLGEQLRGAGS